jgi:hypothetical protein
VDVKRAADLYAQGRTLRQIGTELGVPWTAVGQQLRRAGVTMRRGGPPAHPASTEQIIELRDQGLTWPEIAEQVDMTVSGALSRYRRARPPKSHAWADGSRFSPTPLTRTLRLGVRAAVADHLGRAPTRAELNAARRGAHSLAALGRAQVLHEPGADAEANAGDRGYLVLAKPNVIMNDIRGWPLPEVTLPVARVRITTPRPLETLNARSGMRPPMPGLSKLRVWTASRPPMSQPRWQLPWKSFTGSSAALIDVSDATRDAGSRPETGNKRNRATAASWSIH